MNLPPRLQPYATLFADSGQRHGVDALLLAAICDRESRGGLALSPPGASGTGDGGHGRGLMQIDDRAHSEWIATHRWQDPAINIDKGAEVLAACFAAFPRGPDLAAIAAYNCGPGNVRKAILSGHEPDWFTTGRDYGRDVQRRRDDFRAATAINLTHTEQT